ncbi:hypothetical protein PHK61_13090 [Actinomycetospora lutea]|uniref:hypothetical protein n=1 Tax=Actinomycetospora lutea TaxID=663604 RepID=UPI002365BDE1|nr:hypothetical protein [Actinomycetospora lutea]MDD7939353.1 hypothetical protein [Actinomycetospora lutea]
MTAGRAAPSRWGAVTVPGGSRASVPASDRTVVMAPGVAPPLVRAQQALEGLPSVQRRALVLRWSHGMAVPEIAALDAVPPDVVERRLVHGALAFAHLLGVPSGVTSPGVVAAREIAALGPRAELPHAAGRAPARVSVVASAPVVDAAATGPATTPPLDESRDRRLPFAAACLAAASAAALGVAAATANIDATGLAGDSAGPAAGTGPAPGLGAVIPGPGAVGAGPAAPAIDDLGPGGAPPATDGAGPPSLAAASGPGPGGAVGVVPGGGGPVGSGPAGASAVGGGPVGGAAAGGSPDGRAPGGGSGGSARPQGGGSVAPSSPSAPASSTAPSSSADPAPSSPSAAPTRDDPPPRANASTGGRGGGRDDRGEAGREQGRGGGDAGRGEGRGGGPSGERSGGR